MSSVTLILSQTLPYSFDGLAVTVLVLLTIAGPVLHEYAARHQVATEEMVRDRRLTMQEAQRQVRFLRVSANVTTLLGAAMLLAAIYDLGSRF